MSEELDPLRDFINMVKREANRLVEESNELDMAIRGGRVADLVKKYNPRHQGDADEEKDEENKEENEDETGSEPPEHELERGDS